MFVLCTQTFLSLPRNLPVSLTPCVERTACWNKVVAADNYTYVEKYKRTGNALLTQKQTSALRRAQATLAALLGTRRGAGDAGGLVPAELGCGREALLSVALLFGAADRKNGTPASVRDTDVRSVCMRAVGIRLRGRGK